MTGGMPGLTVRWSLAEAPEDVETALADYVAETSHARFTGLVGLRFKTWRMRPGEWFEGCYVFADDVARDAFQATFTAGAAESPGSRIIRSSSSRARSSRSPRARPASWRRPATEPLRRSR
jgi:hypothetical protein